MHLFLLFLERFSNPDGGPAGSCLSIDRANDGKSFTPRAPRTTRVLRESRARWATNETRRIDRSACRDVHTRELPLEDFISNREALSQYAPHELMDAMVRRWIKSFGGSFQAPHFLFLNLWAWPSFAFSDCVESSTVQWHVYNSPAPNTVCVTLNARWRLCASCASIEGHGRSDCDWIRKVGRKTFLDELSQNPRR